QRQLSVPGRSASSSLFVFSDAWPEEDQLPQQPSLPRLRDPVTVYRQSLPLRVPSRKRGGVGPNAGPHHPAPRHIRPTPRDGRTPIWLDQTWMNQGAFLMRGLEKVRGEFSLTALAYNLRRVLNIVELPKLIAALPASSPT